MVDPRFLQANHQFLIIIVAQLPGKPDPISALKAGVQQREETERNQSALITRVEWPWRSWLQNWPSKAKRFFSKIQQKQWILPYIPTKTRDINKHNWSNRICLESMIFPNLLWMNVGLEYQLPDFWAKDGRWSLEQSGSCPTTKSTQISKFERCKNGIPWVFLRRFLKWGYPKIDCWFHGKSHFRMDENWGYPDFRTPPYGLVFLHGTRWLWGQRIWCHQFRAML